MDIDVQSLLDVVTEPDNLGHAILYGLAGIGESSTIAKHHLDGCRCGPDPETAIDALRTFALSNTCDEPLLAMPHPVLGLAYAITEQHLESDPLDPYRYIPAYQHPKTKTVTTVWCYTIDGNSYARHMTSGNTDRDTFGYIPDDRALTALRALILKLKCALQAPSPI